MAIPKYTSDCPPLPVVRGFEIRHCPGWVGYAVSDNGDAWSCRHNARMTTSLKWKSICPHLNAGHRRSGYMMYSIIGPDGRHHSVKRAKLVLLAFAGPCPSGMEVCHNDGNSTNDNVSNLRYDTKSRNMQDCLRHGTHPSFTVCGERHYLARLTADKVRQIRVRLANGEYLHVVAQSFGVGKSTVFAIQTRRTWKSVK